jgi:hypothetical protein
MQFTYDGIPADGSNVRISRVGYSECPICMATLFNEGLETNVLLLCHFMMHINC